MSDRVRRVDHAELEAALRDLGAALAIPTDGVDPALGARLRIEAARAVERPRPALSGWPERLLGRAVPRSLVLAGAALLLLAGLAVGLGLGVPGIRIIFVGPTPSASASAPLLPTPPAVPSTADQVIVRLQLGVPVALDALDEVAGFHVRIPTSAGLATPAAAVRTLPGDVRQASLVYVPTPGYPAAGNASAAIVVTQFAARLDEGFMAKLVHAGTPIEPVEVNGRAGYWIAGAHEIAYLDAAGQVRFDTVRLAGSVLAWNDGLHTYRIEGAIDLATALALAASLRWGSAYRGDVSGATTSSCLLPCRGQSPKRYFRTGTQVPAEAKKAVSCTPAPCASAPFLASLSPSRWPRQASPWPT